MPVPPCAPQLPHGLWNCVSSRARCGFRQGQILSIHLSRSRSVRSGREWLSLQRHGCCRSLRPSAVCRALLRSGQSHSAQQVFRHRCLIITSASMSAFARLSQSYTGYSSTRSMRLTTDLPLPMPPVIAVSVRSVVLNVVPFDDIFGAVGREVHIL